MGEKTEIKALESVAFLGGLALICVAFGMSQGVLQYSKDFPPLDLEGVAWLWHNVVITILYAAGAAILVALWNLIADRERDRYQIKRLQELERGLLTGQLVGTNPETGHPVCMRPFVQHDVNNADEPNERDSPGRSLEIAEVKLNAVTGEPRELATMRLTNNKRLILSIAAVVSFAIWLFPHWQCHVRHPAARGFGWSPSNFDRCPSAPTSDEMKERPTMTNESPLTLFPMEPASVPKTEPQVTKAECSVWSQPGPAVSRVPQGEARPKLPARESKRRIAQGLNGSPDPLLTVEEFADQLRVTRACVRKWILIRKVGVVKVGRLVRLRSSELRRIVDEGSQPRAEPS